MPFQYQQQQQHFYAQQQPQQPQRPVPYYYDDLSWQQSYVQQPQQPLLQRPSLVETKYIVKKNGPMGSSIQANAAASFFAKAQQRLHLNNNGDLNTSGCSSPPVVAAMRHNNNAAEDSSEERQQFPTNFKAIVHRSPPPIPGQLLRRLELAGNHDSNLVSSTGKIRVILRVAKSSCLSTSVDGDTLGNQIFQMDRRRKQLTMYDPSVFRSTSNQVSLEERKVGVAAPKMFAFDNVFTDQDSQEEVANSALSDIIASVVNGNDGCLFCFGHANLGKSRSMLGSDESSKSMGIIPIAIAWLYRAIKEKKTRTGARFSIRVSALEVTSQRENLRDLLEPYSSENDQSPGVYLRNLPINRLSASNPSAVDYLANQSELRASSADKAAYYLDAALASRSADTRGRESHLLFTLHVYQYSAMGTGQAVSGGRSRLHLIDFGGCERTKTPGGGITLSGLGNVILGIFNGQKHLPHRESKVTQLLRECLGSLTCQATMLAHVSPEPSHYSETLHTVQLASRLHRMRRKRMKSSGHRSRSSSSNGSRSGSGSSSGLTTSTNASSSEFSCDTVVYRGQSDGSGTDGEHPPSMLLRTSRNGSLDDIPRPASSNGGRRRKILTNGAISPRQCLSPTPYLPRSPASVAGRSNSSMSGSFLPAIPEVNCYSGKMPLSGLVPAQSSHRLRQLQQQQQKWVEQTNCNSPKRPSSRHGEFTDQKKYGFMDEAKASMINNWVERQTTSDSNQVFMTQFKQVESDEIKETASVIVHHEQQQPVKKVKPPPPPRRTPPRETTATSLVTALSDSIPMIDDAEIVQVEETENVVTSEMSCQVNEQELLPPPSEPHPLRILSEENLTIVSSFAGSLNELPGSEDDDVDASKLSFFQVPDFAALEKNCISEDRIKQTFQDFEDLQNNKNNQESSYQDPRFKSMDSSSDEKLHTFSKPKLELITPQKQFLLLSQSLRHPDGSSNPELNIIPSSNSEEEKPKLSSRSPGNGRSSSDLENDNNITSPNNNSAPMPMMNAELDEKPASTETDKKPSSRFSFRFLRFFGSTRSGKKSATDNNGRRAKSVDRKVENSQVQKVMQQSEVRSSSSSPMALQKSLTNNAACDPSMLSAISTEWEFEPQEDEANGNSTLFENILIQKKCSQKACKDRKSSGYDSLGGDESSSLDSNEPPKSAIKLSREMNNSLAKAFFATRGSGIHPEPQYSMPTDYYSNRNAAGQPTATSMNIMQYDELDILRMEQRQQQIMKKF